MEGKRIKQPGGTILRLLSACLLYAMASLLRPDAAYAAEGISAVREAYAQGERVFDEAGLFPETERAGLLDQIVQAEQETGFDVLIYTTDASDAVQNEEYFSDAEDLADYIYYEGGFGAGEEKSGVLFLIDMESRDYYFYTRGTAAGYLTDSALQYMEEYGIVSALSSGDYAAAASDFVDNTLMFYREGIQEGQYLYDSQTGERDYAETGSRRGISPWQIILAALFSGGLAYLPCRSVVKSYAMEKEKKLAQGFSLAYRAEAGFQFQDQEDEARLLNQYVTSIPLPRVHNQNHRGGFGGPGGMGGGRSTMSMGRGGGMHGGRGGKF